MSDSILIVEDDPTLAASIRRNLNVRGFASQIATTVAQAILSLQRVRPALAIVDVDLSDGSGWEVVRALRSTEERQAHVIVMSALRPNASLASELRCNGALEKPFPMESLIRMVTRALGESFGATSVDAG